MSLEEMVSYIKVISSTLMTGSNVNALIDMQAAAQVPTSVGFCIKNSIP